MPGPMYHYTFVGTQEKVFPDLSGVLVFDQARPDAVLRPGDEIILPFPFYAAELEPTEPETVAATDALKPVPVVVPVKKTRTPKAPVAEAAEPVAEPVVPS